jgi:hypothetical protein
MTLSFYETDEVVQSRQLVTLGVGALVACLMLAAVAGFGAWHRR